MVGVAGGWSLVVSSLTPEERLELEWDSSSSSSGTTGNWNESDRFCGSELLLFELDSVDNGGDFFTGGTVDNSNTYHIAGNIGRN